MTIFVHGGTTVNVDVPLGVFEVRYASGTNWFGYGDLFGPKPYTVYSKADRFFDFQVVGNEIRGYTITLYNVANGNLSTTEIAESEF
jgi:hypothetical protein